MGMCVEGTPVTYHREYGLYVKHEEVCCPGGPNFSKTRGVHAHIAARPERVIGVLDTSHSQGGWAVAKACKLLHKTCVLYYPVTKAQRADPAYRIPDQQQKAAALGAELVQLQAGRSAVLYHTAKKELASRRVKSYMMPNALKLPEMVSETMAEIARTRLPKVTAILVPASSGTIAAGVWRGLWEAGWEGTLVVHQGYSRSKDAIREYITKMAFGGQRGPLDAEIELQLVDEGYAYADSAKPGLTPPFPCNEFYDLKTFRWWLALGKAEYGKALLWNIG